LTAKKPAIYIGSRRAKKKQKKQNCKKSTKKIKKIIFSKLPASRCWLASQRSGEKKITKKIKKHLTKPEK